MERPINKAEHDKPFRPSHPPRVGYNKTISPFPEWKQEPIKDITQRKVSGEDEKEEKAKFKPTHNDKTRPTPSVAVNIRNLKASFPTVFRK